MDLNTITSVARPLSRAQLPNWTADSAWLAGGTWLFSEPQPHLAQLVDLTGLKWPALTIDGDGLEIAATCTVAQLDALACPSDWSAAQLINPCCRAFLASFKIWKTATVGGNLCMSLPAGPMISLLAALDGICTIWNADGSERWVPVAEFVTDNQRNVLGPGDLLRKVDVSITALKRRAAFRQISLTPVGRSAALLIGTLDGAQFKLTVTASTVHPVQLTFPAMPMRDELRSVLLDAIPDAFYHSDVHGAPDWRKQMTLRLAGEIYGELEAFAR